MIRNKKSTINNNDKNIKYGNFLLTPCFVKLSKIKVDISSSNNAEEISLSTNAQEISPSSNTEKISSTNCMQEILLSIKTENILPPTIKKEIPSSNSAEEISASRDIKEILSCSDAEKISSINLKHISLPGNVKKNSSAKVEEIPITGNVDMSRILKLKMKNMIFNHKAIPPVDIQQIAIKTGKVRKKTGRKRTAGKKRARGKKKPAVKKQSPIIKNTRAQMQAALQKQQDIIQEEKVDASSDEATLQKEALIHEEVQISKETSVQEETTVRNKTGFPKEVTIDEEVSVQEQTEFKKHTTLRNETPVQKEAIEDGPILKEITVQGQTSFKKQTPVRNKIVFQTQIQEEKPKEAAVQEQTVLKKQALVGNKPGFQKQIPIQKVKPTAFRTEAPVQKGDTLHDEASILMETAYTKQIPIKNKTGFQKQMHIPKKVTINEKVPFIKEVPVQQQTTVINKTEFQKEVSVNKQTALQKEATICEDVPFQKDTTIQKETEFQEETQIKKGTALNQQTQKLKRKRIKPSKANRKKIKLSLLSNSSEEILNEGVTVPKNELKIRKKMKESKKSIVKFESLRMKTQANRNAKNVNGGLLYWGVIPKDLELEINVHTKAAISIGWSLMRKQLPYFIQHCINKQELDIFSDGLKLNANNLPPLSYISSYIRKYPAIYKSLLDEDSVNYFSVMDEKNLFYFNLCWHLINQYAIKTDSFISRMNIHKIFCCGDYNFLTDSNAIAEVTQGIKTAKKRKVENVFFCISATGKVFNPLILNKGLMVKTYDSSVYADSKYWQQATPTGTMCAEAFHLWLITSFKPYLNEEDMEGPVILFFNSDQPYLSVPVLDFCKENQIIIFCIPATIAHLLNPLSMSCFHQVAMEYYSICKKRVEQTQIHVKEFSPLLLIAAMDRVNLNSAARQAFEVSGLLKKESYSKKQSTSAPLPKFEDRLPSYLKNASFDLGKQVGKLLCYQEIMTTAVANYSSTTQGEMDLISEIKRLYLEQSEKCTQKLDSIDDSSRQNSPGDNGSKPMNTDNLIFNAETILNINHKAEFLCNGFSQR